MFYFLLSFLIFLTPFIINPFSEYFFEPPKVIFAQILIEILLALFLFRKGNNFKFFNRYQLTLSAILFILTILHLWLMPNSQLFFGNEVRLQGTFLLWHLMVLSLLSSQISISKLPVALFPVSLIFLLMTIFLVEPDINGRAIGTLGEANALSSSAIFFWPLAFFINLQGKFKNNIFRFGIALSALAIILLSGSRSGLIAFFVQVVFLISNKFISLKKAVILSSLLILLLLTLPLIQGGGWFENRSEIWRTAVFAGSQTIPGHGFGNIEQALSTSSEVLRNNIRLQSVDSSHNFLLDYFVQGGIVGLGVIVLMVSLSLKGLIKAKKSLEIVTLLGLIFVLLFNPASSATLVAFWFMLGQGFRDS